MRAERRCKGCFDVLPKDREKFCNKQCERVYKNRIRGWQHPTKVD